MNAAAIATIISAFIVFFIINICITVSLENRDPTKTISWLLVLTLLPGIGLAFYLLFGENMRKHQWERIQKSLESYLSNETIQHIFDDNSAKYLEKFMTVNSEGFEPLDRNIMRLALKSGTAPITMNNKIDIFTEGETKFEQMLQDMEKAKDHIHIEYFIIKDSEIGNRVRQVLEKKAKEGVTVRIIFDVIGCKGLMLRSAFLRSLKESGCEIAAYKKSTRLLLMIKHLNYRNHRKVCVIDGKIAYIGGINIGDEYVHKDKKFGFWRDTHLRIEGAAVYMLQLSFLMDWLARTDQVILDNRYYPEITAEGESVVQIIRSGIDTPEDTIYQSYFYAIAQAKESVYIETPYFIPDAALLTAIKTAAMAGVDVRIIFPSFPDHIFVYHASESYLEQIAQAGAKVHFYQKGFIHSKVVLVDKEVASVGTANMDIRSFMFNSEINALIYDDKTVNELYQMFYEDLKSCKSITYEEMQKKTIIKKVKQSLCRLLSPLF